MKNCDLHIHSNYSDGSFSPRELISLAEQAGLSALALTDHNTSKGLAAFMKAAEKSAVEAVAGCEFSAEYEKKEYHILGLFLPVKSWEELEDFVLFQHMAKHHSNELLIRNLRKAGYQITYEEVAAITDADEFNRAHVARILLQKGYVQSVAHAFETLLGENQGFYTAPKRVSVGATIRFIKDNGGVAVWAHPFHRTDAQTVQRLLPEFVAAGLDGLETLYTTFTDEQTRCAKALAGRYGLLESGGSDFHGAAKPDVLLGKGHGDLQVPFAFYEALKERAAKID